MVHKTFGDSFEGTDLEDVLAPGRRRAPGRHRRPDRPVHPVDHPRRLHPRLRRDPGRRRAHDGGPQRVGRSAAGQGHRAHEPVLGEPGGARPHRRRHRDQGRHFTAELLRSREVVRSRRVDIMCIIGARDRAPRGADRPAICSSAPALVVDVCPGPASRSARRPRGRLSRRVATAPPDPLVRSALGRSGGTRRRASARRAPPTFSVP